VFFGETVTDCAVGATGELTTVRLATPKMAAFFLALAVMMTAPGLTPFARPVVEIVARPVLLLVQVAWAGSVMVLPSDIAMARANWKPSALRPMVCSPGEITRL
jgi:hypothetical protein